MSNNPLVTLLVLNWNGGELLQNCLNSLRNTKYSPIEILIVDNASTDNSIEIIKKYSEVRLIQNKENLGYAAGNNVGFRAAKGEYVVTLNNDIAVEPDWLDIPIAEMESNRSIGIVSCRQMNYFQRHIIDGLYQFPCPYLVFLNYGADLVYDPENPLHSEPGFVMGANGASAIYRKSMLGEIGFFDETYFAYHEDCDLSFRAFLNGWNCLYLPSSVVYHMRSYSFKGKANSYNMYFERNRFRFILKNYSLLFILTRLPLLVYLEIRIFLGMLIRGSFRCYFNSRWFVLKNLKDMMKGEKMFPAHVRTAYYKFCKFKKVKTAPFI